MANQDIDTEWLQDPSKLSATVRVVENADCKANREADARFLYNYYQRPIIDIHIPGEYVTPAILRRNCKNLTRKYVDTAMATLCRPMHQSVVPVGADQTLANNCKVLTRLSDGIDSIVDFKSKSMRVARDGMICSLGGLKWYSANGEMLAERVNPRHIVYRYSDEEIPPQIFVPQPVDRKKLMKAFPKHAARIEQLPKHKEDPIIGVDPYSTEWGDRVLVDEAWHMGDKQNPGRHVIAIDGAWLVDEKWLFPFPPIAFYKWSDAFRGLGGKSLASQLEPYHNLTTNILTIIVESARGNVPKIFVNENDSVKQLSDMEWEVVRYNGMSPPDIRTPNAISQQLLDMLPMIDAWAANETGISEMIANNTRPQGLNSEPAQLAWMDIANVRGFEPQTRWEKFVKDCMKIKIALAETIYRDKEIRVEAPGSRMIELIKWPKDMKEEQYSCRVMAASGLPLTMSGRLQALSTMRALAPSVFTEADLARAIEIPDVEKNSDLHSSYMDMADKMIEKATDEGVFVMPSEIQGPAGLEFLIKRAQQTYQLEYVNGTIPARNLEVLRRLVLAAKARLGIMSPQGQPVAPPVAAAPPPSIAANALPAREYVGDALAAAQPPIG